MNDKTPKRFDIVTIFPRIFESYFGESIVKRAQESGAVTIVIHNLRDYTTDRHRTVDDVPYGGGAGMVLKIEPIYKCVTSIKSQISNLKSQKKGNIKVRTILFSAKGKRYTQRDAMRLAKYDQLILICGRYEGVDERVVEHVVDEEISIGDYVLTGGEIPAMVLVDSITRLIPSVLGNAESLSMESHTKSGTKEYPHYTRPEEFQSWLVPRELVSGNHKEIERWRDVHTKRSKKTN